MEHSNYNSLIPITENRALLYNALSDKFLIVTDSYMNILQWSPEDIRKSNQTFYNTLVNAGFFVKDNTSEYTDVVAQGMENCTSNKGRFEIIINPTIRCNFKCWYCYEQHEALTKMKPHTIEKVKRLIYNIVTKSNIKILHLSFFGGEPLLYYKDCVQPIIDYAREIVEHCDKSIELSFTSNGFLLNHRVISHLTQEENNIWFQITLDGHRDMHNKVRFTQNGEGSYDRILGNIVKLLSKGIHVNLRINYTAVNIVSVNGILDDIRSFSVDDLNYLTVDFQKVWQEKESVEKEERTEEIIDKFKKEISAVSESYSRVDTFRNPCYGDRTNSVVVNYNGDVYKCTARDFIPSNRLGRLMNDGEIKWDKPNILIDRLKAKFSNPACRKCRIFPICGGGCVQTAEDVSFSRCLRGYTPQEKDRIILARFHRKVVSGNEKKD